MRAVIALPHHHFTDSGEFMARYLLIEVDNNDAADNFRARVEQFDPARGIRIAGMFGVPTQWCTCHPTEDYHKNEIVRGKKLGWWVHRICRRARPGTHNLENLIKPADRSYGVETGRVMVAPTVTVFEVPVQNIR